MCLVGDAAHASTPHHGAGAGFCIEDVAVLSSLLEDDCVAQPEDLEAVFSAFDENRRERDQWLVQSSREAADMYEWRAPHIGKGYDEGIQKEINDRQARIWGIDLGEAITSARAALHRRLTAS